MDSNLTPGTPHAHLREFASATTSQAALAATAYLLDDATPGGAAIGDDTLSVVRGLASEIRTGSPHRAMALAVLVWTARVNHQWRKTAAARTARSFTTKTPLADHVAQEEFVGIELSGLASELAQADQDQDPQTRAMSYLLHGMAADPRDAFPYLSRCAESDLDSLASACATEAVLIAAARSAPAGSAEAARWLRARIAQADDVTLGRLRHALDGHATWETEAEQLDEVLGSAAAAVPHIEPTLWRVECI